MQSTERYFGYWRWRRRRVRARTYVPTRHFRARATTTVVAREISKLRAFGSNPRLSSEERLSLRESGWEISITSAATGGRPRCTVSSLAVPFVEGRRARSESASVCHDRETDQHETRRLRIKKILYRAIMIQEKKKKVKSLSFSRNIDELRECKMQRSF